METPPQNQCNPSLPLELGFNIIFMISLFTSLAFVIIFSGYGLKISEEVYLVTTPDWRWQIEGTKRGNELWFVHMERWLVLGNMLFQMRKLNDKENLIPFPVGRGMTGPSLWVEKRRKQGDDPSNVITVSQAQWGLTRCTCCSKPPSLSHGIHVSEPGGTWANTLSNLLIYRVGKWITPLCSW